MPVETVHLVVGHHVEDTLDFVDLEEVAGAVEHEAAVAESRFVRHFAGRGGILRDCRVGPFGHHVARQEHFERLEGVEEASGRLCPQCDAFGRDIELVALGAERGVVDVQADDLGRGVGRGGHAEPRGRVQGFDKAQGLRLEAVGQGLAGHPRLRGKGELTLARGVRCRAGNDILTSRAWSEAEGEAQREQGCERKFPHLFPVKN